MNCRIKRAWKAIKGFENEYRVSDDGLVMSIYRKYRHPKRTNGYIRTRILTPLISSYGDPTVTLYSRKPRNTVKVKKLVAEAFIPNPQNFKCIIHIDGNKRNNKKSNLLRISKLDWYVLNGRKSAIKRGQN